MSGHTDVVTPACTRQSPTGPPPAAGVPTYGGDDLSCVGPQARLFFSEDASSIERAKALCSTCAGRTACLAGALERREPWGVWGGELFDAGTVIEHKRPRGRPRKWRSREPGHDSGRVAPTW